MMHMISGPSLEVHDSWRLYWADRYKLLKDKIVDISFPPGGSQDDKLAGIHYK